ncbi:histidine phosphatase superfamily [Suillus clintonianus]|uniref:histidine phosphatase superfamily n=1 Tax=Suillus clintonianus TaxID=1904413 RepID=UPI001B86B4AF|nr:histidine phosphatase superfamily [Suillus clintonianus]KAG2157186.1 histidine phosphatase superfamily [Suillus clintonianus]
MLMHRHGSRGPAGKEETRLIDSLVDTLKKHHEAIRDADLPENLHFLQTEKGYESHLDPESLSIIGRQQLFNHGVEFGLKYPDFTTERLLSSTVQRVIDSMYFFAQGRFGREAEDKELLTVDDMPGPVSWITPWNSCSYDYQPAFELVKEWTDSYLPDITERLNGLLPHGVKLTDDNTHGALYACAYDLAARDESPWCNVFDAEELANFEYEMDLFMVATIGYQAPNDAGRVMGSVFVNTLINRFSDTGEEDQSLYLEFGHDATIITALAALDLNRDDPPLSSHGVPQHRKFRTSYQTPFAAKMIWERFTCTESFHKPQIRLVLNDETYPLQNCAKTEQDRLYGTCSLEAFISANKFSTDIKFGDETWQAACSAHSEGLYVQG